MTYNPATDFVSVWRAIAGGVQKGEIPGLDFVVAALGRSGLINISTSNIAPVANQAVTAWFAPATPSYSAEGGLSLWNAVAVAYQAATPRLLLEMLAAAEKVAAVPTAISSLLDTLGAVQGDVAFRGAAGWQALAPGTAGQVLTSAGAAANPLWAGVSVNLDAIGNVQGDILYRGAGAWAALAPGAAGTVLTSGGAAANPAWAAATVGVVTVKKQVFTGTGTYTPSAGMLFAQIECVGGGGGSGGMPGQGAGNSAGGGGGGSGSYARFLATAAAIGVSKAVTIGAGGAAGAAAGPTAGGNGGDTSVGTLCIAKGGTGSPSGSPTAGAGGVAGTGDFVPSGADGCGGSVASILTVTAQGGAGGAAAFGGGNNSVASQAAAGGVAGKGYGNGASGGITWNNSSANGAAGAPGVVYITEYCSQ